MYAPDTGFDAQRTVSQAVGLIDTACNQGYPGVRAVQAVFPGCTRCRRDPARGHDDVLLGAHLVPGLVTGWLIGNSVHKARAHAEQLRAQVTAQAVNAAPRPEGGFRVAARLPAPTAVR